MKKKILICLSLFSILSLFLLIPKNSKAEITQSSTYTNYFTSKAYYYQTSKLFTSWDDYSDHVGSVGTCDITVKYTFVFDSSDIKFQVNSIYINGVITNNTRYMNVFLNNTKYYNNWQVVISGQPPITALNYGGMQYLKEVRHLMYVDYNSFRYYIGFITYTDNGFLTPVSYNQESFSDQYRSYNLFGLSLGSSEEEGDFYNRWVIPKPIGDGYAIPTINVDYSSTINYEMAVQSGKNEILNNPNKYNLYSSKQYQQYGSSEYYRGVRVGSLTPAKNRDFKSLISAVFDVPIQTFTSLFDFNLLGFNMKPLVATLLTLSIMLGVIRFIASAFRSS